MTRRNLSSVVIFALICCIGCSQTTGSGLIKSPGNYQSPNAKYVVKVTTRSKSIIDYTIADSASNNELASGGGFSNAQRWFLYWDDTNRLWSYNSDMGGFGYWLSENDATFVFTDIGAGDEKSTVPKPVYDNMPSSIRRHFGWE